MKISLQCCLIQSIKNIEVHMHPLYGIFKPISVFIKVFFAPNLIYLHEKKYSSKRNNSSTIYMRMAYCLMLDQFKQTELFRRIKYY